MNNQYNFTEFNKMSMGMYCSFVSDDDNKPIRFKIENVTTPLGISDYSGKKSVLINLTEEIQILNEVHEQACKRFPSYNLENPHKKSEKYGLQIKCNLNQLTLLFDEAKDMIEDPNEFEKHSVVSLVGEVSTVWSKSNKNGGISLRLCQMKKSKTGLIP